VIVYADREEVVETGSFRQRIEQASDSLERLILEGQLEAGVMDARSPEEDDVFDPELPLPERITIRTPEGFAFYGLYPQMYEESARRFLQEHRPDACVVIGIRSIGATLSRVVADATNANIRITVRPRGHPFDRELRLSPRLENCLRQRPTGWFLVVDEGPGLSGSSFMSVARKLEELGVTRDRIVLFAAHRPDASQFKSDYARKYWNDYRCYVTEFDARRFVPEGACDISGGAWRKLLYSEESAYPAVQAQHERRKYLHDGRLWKFAGLAHLGRHRYERGQRLLPFCPAVDGLEDGFLISGWAQGRPAALSEDLLDWMARYLAHLRSEFAIGKAVPKAALEEMIEVNTSIRLTAPEPATVVALDGRMLPQEWIETDAGFTKVDALDHHDDHFFPGCQDIAWDIAGAAVEWGFEPEVLMQRYLRLQSDSTLRARMPFYMTAYRAYRYGYCTMAAESLGETPDGAGFKRLANKYAKDLGLAGRTE
jgi:hypothetical protein